jgi:hypothetical protein
VSRNGERKPPRPKIELVTPAASPEEAAAVVAAIERFVADTAPAPAPPSRPPSPWQRAALREGVGISQTPSKEDSTWRL